MIISGMVYNWVSHIIYVFNVFAHKDGVLNVGVAHIFDILFIARSDFGQNWSTKIFPWRGE